MSMNFRKAHSISITGGKGGVGKTSITLKIAKVLSEWGHRVLVLDCDYNLSNTMVKLRLPVNNDFYLYMTGRKSFEECLHRMGNFHLFPGCNGNLDVFNSGVKLDKVVVDILVKVEGSYDFILLDCPAGISKDALTLNAYTDFRFFVINPDFSSITDSYSLIKILNQSFCIRENHCVINKITNYRQYQRIVKVLSETVENFLESRLSILGPLFKEDGDGEIFDSSLMGKESKNHRYMIRMLKEFTENNFGINPFIKQPLIQFGNRINSA